MGKPEGKKPLGRPERRWEDSIKMGLEEMCWRDLHWICLALDRDTWRVVVHVVMKFRVP